MTPDDTPISRSDAAARAARLGLGQLASSDAPGELSWADVQGRARRVTLQRRSAVGAACAVVAIAAAVTVATIGSGDGDTVHVAGGSQTTTTPAPSTSTTLHYDSSSAATTTFPGNSSSAPPLTAGTTIGPPSLPNLPSTSPLPDDFSGTMTVRSATETQPAEVGIGEPVEIDAIIRNISDREIWASSSLVPTSVATFCSSDSASAGQTLWWMTNSPMKPGDTDGRTGPFTPTAAYAGTVTCEVVIVTTGQQGTVFDQSAGGDAATATILGRVTGVPPVTFLVSVPSSTTTSTTTVPEWSTSTTIP
jgi:hypothetical protein